MAYDGLFAGVVARDLNARFAGAKIEKVTQPEPDGIVLQLRAGEGRAKLLLSASPNAARVQLTARELENPQTPPPFCMLLRKHIQAARITGVRQTATERVIAIDMETVNEMGYSVNKTLIAETMGKHSNIVLTDAESGRIIDSIKRISIDVNRYRQLLPGLTYVAPPPQDKKDFWTCDFSQISSVREVQGMPPATADALKPEDLPALRERLLAGRLSPCVYLDANGVPADVHVFPQKQLEGSCPRLDFPTPYDALDWYYEHRRDTNRVLQKADDLARSIGALIDKQLLKKQRLLEDLQKAEEADRYRLKGELLNANLHLARPGDRSITVTSYYDGTPVTIELDERISPAKNAQAYYKKYAKLKSSAKEKLVRLEECRQDIDYLESVRTLVQLSSGSEELELQRAELVRQGFLRARRAQEKKKESRPKPRRFRTSSGKEITVGRNNSENDWITFRLGQKTDYWFHTKDLHGSHVLLSCGGEEPTEADIFETAAVAAYYSKGKDSQNVPVDYVPLRYVKKPAGAKPGMVIFTNNRTVWVDPKLPGEDEKA